MRFCVVGAGVIGKLRAQSVGSNPKTSLVGVVDPDEGRAQRVAGTARVYGDWADIVASDEVDCVIVSTPVQFHEAICVAALSNGKHVLCEKPLSNSLESCRAMLDCARSHGRTLACGLNMRYYPSFKYAKAVIDEGRIGRLDHVRVFGGHDGLANFRADWMYKGELSGGGAMMDVGIHMTDLARFVLGEVAEVYGVVGSNIWNVEGSEDRAVAIFKSPSGVPATYEATWNEWKGYGVWLEAYGELGMVRAHYAPMSNLVVTHAKPGAPRKQERKRYPGIMVREKLKSWESTTLITFEEELADFLRMIAGESVPLADGWAGYRAVEIAQCVYESSRSGQPVRLSEPAARGT
jgi:predicted dehydrogenase